MRVRYVDPYQPPLPDEPPPQRRRIWPYVLSGCAVMGLLSVAACGGLLYLGFRQVSGHGEVAAQFDRLFDEIDQGRAAEYYRAHATDDLKRATSEADFVSFAELVNEKLGELQAKRVAGFSMHSSSGGTRVEATYDCDFEHGKGTVRTTYWHQQGGWRLQGFRVDSPNLYKSTAREKCPHCGTSYELGAKFCPHCGQEIAGTEAVAQ